MINPSIKVTIHLDGDVDPSTLKVEANGKDMSSYFQTCGSAPCDVSAIFRSGDEMKSGWNYLIATANAPTGGASSSRLRFYKQSAADDPTDGTAAPFSTSVYMSPTDGIEVGYAPGQVNGKKYGNGECTNPSAGFTLVSLDRSTLAWNETTCYGPNDNDALTAYLKGLDRSKLLLGSNNPGTALGKLNLSLIGGTDFSASNAPTAYSYSIVGYGGSTTGFAAESYDTSADAPWHGLKGALVNLGTSTPTFGFQSTDPVGFAIVPNGTSAAVTVGNVHNLPFSGNTTNYTAADGFTSVTYTAPSANGTGSGIWVLVLDRYTLQLVSSTTFSSQSPSGGFNVSQMDALSQQLKSLDNSKLVFLTTLYGSNPDYLPLLTWENATGEYTTVLNNIKLMGVSPYAFDKPMGNESRMGIPVGTFSMVGIPGNFTNEPPPDGSSPSPCDALWKNSTLTCGPNNDQWFSSTVDTQQNETGALKGSLTRNRAFQYTPTGVNPFTPAAGATADDLLADSLSAAIGSAPSVAWPLADTQGHRNAYSWLSGILTKQKISACRQPTGVNHCNDIRYYYTGDQAGSLTSLDVNSVVAQNPPSAAPGFTIGPASEESDAITQISAELEALGNVKNYQTWVEDIATNSTQNIGSQLAVAATQTANDLNQATGQPITGTNGIADSNLTLAADTLNIGAGMLAAAGAVCPPAAVIGGIMTSVSSIISLVKDSKQPPQTPPDPYVNQLGDLLSQTSNQAAQVEQQVSGDVQTSMDTFFNGVFSDWFKLQSIAMLSTNSNLPAWYVEDASKGITTEGAAALNLANARRIFLFRILGQYFQESFTWNVPEIGLVPAKYKTAADLNTAITHDTIWKGALTAYTWWVRNNGGAAYPGFGYQSNGIWDYNFVCLKAPSHALWPDSFGNTLFDPPNKTDGTGNLNLNRDVFYDSNIMPKSGGNYSN